jgi:hypothetical protein
LPCWNAQNLGGVWVQHRCSGVSIAIVAGQRQIVIESGETQLEQHSGGARADKVSFVLVVEESAAPVKEHRPKYSRHHLQRICASSCMSIHRRQV